MTGGGKKQTGTCMQSVWPVSILLSTLKVGTNQSKNKSTQCLINSIPASLLV